MASVDRADTPITVNRVARSLPGCDGRAAASAMAAEAPQIAVAPPVSSPKRVLKPMARAASIATTMVMTTEATTITTGCHPSAAICEKVMRMPSRATPMRSTSREVNSIPGLQAPSVARKFTAMPSRSANSMTGAW